MRRCNNRELIYDRSEALFYFFRLEDQVPENHLLRLIEKHISFEFVRQVGVWRSYSSRPKNEGQNFQRL